MYAYIKGTLVFTSPSEAIVENQGIGYTIHIPCSTFSLLPQIGSPVQLYTSFVVRELSQALYGFLSAQERDLFDLLMTITGVGPKLALSIIGHLPYQELHAAVQSQNIALLCKVPGIGKKTAERLVIELRDKLAALALPGMPSLALSQPLDTHTQRVQDAMLALVNLGYKQNIAQQAIKQSLKELPESIDLATLITAALKQVR